MRIFEHRVAAFAPGRVNLIGEHTDYNGGLALPFATEQGITVTATAVDGDRFEVHARDLDEHDRFDAVQPAAASDWRGYVRGAVAELRALGIEPPAARLEIGGDVPRGSGLSSSAALEVAVCKALIALADASSPSDLELAQLCGRIEHEWVGTQSGLLDQLASLAGRADHAVRIDFRSFELQQVILDLGEHRLVTLDSGESHANAESGYNERRAECDRACELLDVDSLRDADLRCAATLPAPLDARVQHVVQENARVDEMVAALAGGDLTEAGALLDSSHASLRDLYEVSTPAVESAVDALKRAGALGARIMGGGFGGHVLGLVAPGAELPARAVAVRPGDGARIT